MDWGRGRVTAPFLHQLLQCGCPVNNAYVPNTRGGLRGHEEHWFLTEDGLYEVLIQSRKPIAKVRVQIIILYLDLMVYYYNLLTMLILARYANS